MRKDGWIFGSIFLAVDFGGGWILMSLSQWGCGWFNRCWLFNLTGGFGLAGCLRTGVGAGGIQLLGWFASI